MMKLTRPDGQPVYIVKAMVVSWSKETDSYEHARIVLVNQFQIVKESCEKIVELMA